MLMITSSVVYKMLSPPFSCLFLPLTLSERGYVRQSLLAPFQRRKQNRASATTGIERLPVPTVSSVQQFSWLQRAQGSF